MSSRFSDNPFRDPNLPSEQQDYLNRRNEAFRHYYRTGDPGPAREFGFDLPDKSEQVSDAAKGQFVKDGGSDMEMGDVEKDRAWQMAHEGKTIAQISKELDLDYWQVWQNVERSWQGTKWIVTNRLNLLVKENDPAIREQLVSEAKECIEYLYQRGRHMGKQMDRARNALDT